MRAQNGQLWGKIIVRKSCYRIEDGHGKLIARVRRSCACGSMFKIISPDHKKKFGVIKRQSRKYYQIEPNHYDYTITLSTVLNDFKTKLLLVGFTFFLDYRLDSNYRPFLRFGSEYASAWIED